MKLIAELRDVEQKAQDVKLKERDARATQQQAKAEPKKKGEEIAEEKRAIKEDLPQQFEAAFEKAKTFYHDLFANFGLNFNQVGPWRKLDDRVLLPPSNDEDDAEDDTVDQSVDA